MSDSEFCRAPCAPVGTSAQRACADARQERLRLAQRTSWSSAACYRAWAACTGSALLAPCLLLEGLLARQQARNRVWHASLCQRGRKRAPGSRQCGQVPRCSRGPSRWPGAQRSLSVRVFPPPPSACTYICNHCRTTRAKVWRPWGSPQASAPHHAARSARTHTGRLTEGHTSISSPGESAKGAPSVTSSASTSLEARSTSARVFWSTLARQRSACRGRAPRCSRTCAVRRTA
jgi:hypothetical protein